MIVRHTHSVRLLVLHTIGIVIYWKKIQLVNIWNSVLQFRIESLPQRYFSSYYLSPMGRTTDRQEKLSILKSLRYLYLPILQGIQSRKFIVNNSKLSSTYSVLKFNSSDSPFIFNKSQNLTFLGVRDLLTLYPTF